jgi:hypothetical protein
MAAQTAGDLEAAPGVGAVVLGVIRQHFLGTTFCSEQTAFGLRSFRHSRIFLFTAVICSRVSGPGIEIEIT